MILKGWKRLLSVSKFDWKSNGNYKLLSYVFLADIKANNGSQAKRP